MVQQIPGGKPVDFKRLSDSCIEFSLNKLYISDNGNLFVAPQTDFCRACFQRRYLTQMMASPMTEKIENNTLNLAEKLDQNQTPANAYWHVFKVANQQPTIKFKLASYEDCPVCGTNKTSSKEESTKQYIEHLSNTSTPDLNATFNQVFSFGFARTRSIGQRIAGLNNPAFDKLLNNNYHARITFRLIGPDGHHSDSSSTGFSADQELAQLKSVMEYLERYAYNMRTCRYITEDFDEKIINRYLSLYRHSPTEYELKHIKQQACWGVNLSTKETHAIPLSFIYSKGELKNINPSSSGFGAHTEFSLSLCSSILELVERDAFVRFWHQPKRAYSFTPAENIQKELDSIVAIIKKAANNETLTSNCYILQSPTRLPVVLLTISSDNFATPPALCFGCGSDFTFNEAITGALNELRLNVVNLVKGITVLDGFLHKKFSPDIKSIPDRMNLYATCAPREKLKFLDNNKPLIDGIVEDAKAPGLESLIDRFNEIGCDIYGIDFTPQCFQDKNVFVTRAFSPDLYPLQFDQENAFNLETDSLSAQGVLPHFFI